MWILIPLTITGTAYLILASRGKRPFATLCKLLAAISIGTAIVVFPLVMLVNPAGRPWHSLLIGSLLFGPTLLLSFAGLGALGVLVERLLFMLIPVLNYEKRESPNQPLQLPSDARES